MALLHERYGLHAAKKTKLCGRGVPKTERWHISSDTSSRWSHVLISSKKTQNLSFIACRASSAEAFTNSTICSLRSNLLLFSNFLLDIVLSYAGMKIQVSEISFYSNRQKLEKRGLPASCLTHYNHWYPRLNAEYLTSQYNSDNILHKFQQIHCRIQLRPSSKNYPRSMHM